jgi:poly(3-hydroxybutyrate) depolymerase
MGGTGLRGRWRRSAGLVAGVALLLVTASCDWPEGTRYVHPVFDDVEVTRDVVYRSTTTYDGQPIDLRLDIYEPAGDDADERPAVMWMFGGGFTAGQKEHMSMYAEDSARRGYVGVTLQYRLRPEFSVEGVIDAYGDALAGVEWLIAHADEYRIDPQAVVPAGYSAGAYNAMHVLDFPADTPAAGGIAIAGGTGVMPTAGDRPTIMFHGTADTTVETQTGLDRCNAGNAVGAECTWVPYEGRDHFIAYYPDTQPDIMARAHDWVFEEVLWPLGYRPGTA